jgi:hypothetical protein
LQLSRNRYIDIDHIADITYTPAGSLAVVVTYDPADQREIERSPPSPSYLNIELKSGEVIQLEGEEADAVWADFQKTRRHPGTE